METLKIALLVTLAAGVGGTGLGGLLGAMFRKDSDKSVSLLLSFAAGVMLSIVCFDLILDALNPANSTHQTNVFIVVIGIVLGVGIVYILNYLIDRYTNCEVKHIDASHPHTADDLDELIHSDHLEAHIQKKDSRPKLFIAGLVMASAIALHNVPEGMTIGASYVHDSMVNSQSGMILAMLIGLHNIPEGMSVSVPLISGGMGKFKAVVITALTGLPTVLGAFLGFLLGDIGPLGLALSLSFASGAMIYVVFGEILPQSILMYRSKMPAFFVVIGMITGLVITYI